MNYMLDTHAFLWALFDSEQLSETALSIIMDPDNSVFISLVSFWEIACKYNAGKLSLHNISPEALPKYAEKAGFEILGPSSYEVSSSCRLPVLKQRDPFDRLIIWQCISNNICMISKDPDLTEYGKHGLQIAW